MGQPDIQEYLTSNESIAFPFSENAPGLLQQKDAAPVHGAAAMLTRDFLLDMVVTVPARYQARICLASIARSGPAYTFTFTTPSGFLFSGTVSALPAARSMVAFQASVIRITARMVSGPSFISFLEGIADGDTDSFQDRLPLEVAAVEFTPFKLLDLLVGATELTDGLVLYEGYNIQLDSAPSDPAAGTPATLKITAGAGLGAGRYPCGDAAPVGYIGRINGQGADAGGNLQLDSGSCHRLIPDPASSRLLLGNDCLPCCTCDDYANAVAALRKLFSQLTTARDSLASATGDVNSHITAWNTVIVPALFKPRAEIYVSRGYAAGLFTSSDPQVSSGKSPNYGSIVATIKNPSSQSLSNVGIAITGLGPLTVVETVYFDSTGQHTAGTAVSWTGLTMPANSFFKPAVLVRNVFPSQVAGTFIVTVTVGGITVVTKSVTVP